MSRERRACEAPTDDCYGKLGHFLISVSLIREHRKNLAKTISISLLDLQLRSLSDASEIQELNPSFPEAHWGQEENYFPLGENILLLPSHDCLERSFLSANV